MIPSINFLNINNSRENKTPPYFHLCYNLWANQHSVNIWLRKVNNIGKENVFGLEYHPLFMYLHNMAIPKNCKSLIISLLTNIFKNIYYIFIKI